MLPNSSLSFVSVNQGVSFNNLRFIQQGNDILIRAIIGSQTYDVATLLNS
jgi:hypothetical protein